MTLSLDRAIEIVQAGGPALLRQLFDDLAAQYLLRSGLDQFISEFAAREQISASEYVNFNFETEDDAIIYLRALLRPNFAMRHQVCCRHLLDGNRLRIDNVARPKPEINCPFDWYGLEVKCSCRGGDYNRALKQAVDYTFCQVDDARAPSVNGQRVPRVYLFPGLPETAGESYWVNRFVGLFHVGLIFVQRRRGRDETYFVTSGDRQWSSDYGPVARAHNIHHRVGSGVLCLVKGGDDG
jgi:hypothetical protein